ncbi:Mu transposase C-terminal domain-containing protein [Nocardia beijingensis]|uniref:Mu transposase C-terminal domain-containing protein n=1 Tax=Nocardia implantans TaxID=3108168 RepID=A0ABU6AZG7_9NOCA|nr:MULTISPECIES: Mu transposase C-terminal domain-containing protein [unclassified Nocardia]MEA3533084.1 Mu transposase C-terminal domain-containing protein [Nocardia sp. CDC192]MEB3512892.1 Mu transposase C-terminal domain-containing protein [Nocardia sp. CDC186]MEB3512944.1 Mu transposase C-terminal domain-containing protein [Nocardia sp. CDC186]
MTSGGLTELSEADRRQAMNRLEVLRPYLEDDVPLTRAAAASGTPLRTAQRWLHRYRSAGLTGLAPTHRRRSSRRTHPELVRLIEAMALRRPRPSLAAITRRAARVAAEQGWTPVSYSTVRAIVTDLDPAMLTLAHDGAAAFRDTYELVYRRRAEHPNQMWQADHTQLDILVVEAGRNRRPWLTVVLDDCSRAVPGYTVNLGAPSALNTSLALRQAIWTKPDPGWPMCGIPETLYVDHGSDFTSQHLAQVAADLKFQIVHSTVARPQGRGKIERFFGSINTELLTELPGHLVAGKPVTAPALSLRQLDEAINRFVTATYHQRTHSEIGASPQQAWVADGWLPRMPDSLEQLDLLLVTAATPRVVHRDGIHFQGLRYLHPTLAAYVRETVTIRYDPRDITALRVFHRNRFLCTAIDPNHSGDTIGLKDIQAARRAYRHRIRQQINERITVVTDYLPAPAPPVRPEPASPPPGPRLRAYSEE